jgi:hypothetical protein
MAIPASLFGEWQAEVVSRAELTTQASRIANNVGSIDSAVIADLRRSVRKLCADTRVNPRKYFRFSVF